MYVYECHMSIDLDEFNSLNFFSSSLKWLCRLLWGLGSKLFSTEILSWLVYHLFYIFPIHILNVIFRLVIYTKLLLNVVQAFQHKLRMFVRDIRLIVAPHENRTQIFRNIQISKLNGLNIELLQNSDGTERLRRVPVRIYLRHTYC